VQNRLDIKLFVFEYISYKDMSNKDAEKEEMKDETHEVEDTEQDEQDAENENDADYQQE
jgi:hypothetical protein